MSKATEEHLKHLTKESLESFREGEDTFITYASSTTKNGLAKIGVNGMGQYCVMIQLCIMKYSSPEAAINSYKSLCTDFYPVIFEGKRFKKIDRFDCHILSLSESLGGGAGYGTVFPISSKEFREKSPTKADVNIVESEVWTTFHIYDDLGNLHSVCIHNSLEDEIAAAKKAAEEYGLIKNVADKNLEPPRYKHDCDNCEYLGRFNEYDLYFCDTEPTVIARFSDEGADYASGLSFARPDGNKSLYEAKNRAIKAGLLKD